MNPDISKHFINVLDENRQATYQNLKEITKNWYLAGGTALALQIGHRISYDFDFFSQTKISLDFRKKIVDLFNNQVRFSMDSPEQLTFFTSKGIKITFAYTPYKPIYQLITHQNIEMESVGDIGADKAFTIGRRGALRDYVDLYYMLNGYLELKPLIENANRKYQAMFDEKLFLEQLDYMDDITNQEIEFLEDRLSIGKIQEYLHANVVEYVNKKL